MFNMFKKIGLMVIVVMGGITFANASGDSAYETKRHDWPHAGPFGKFDKDALQRGPSRFTRKSVLPVIPWTWSRFVN